MKLRDLNSTLLFVFTCKDYVNDPFIPQRGRRHSSNEHHKSLQSLTTATHLNSREEASTNGVNHMNQMMADQQLSQLQQQPQNLNTDRVDDNANFHRFIQRLLKPDILSDDGPTGKNRIGEDTPIGEENPLPPISPNIQHNLSPSNSMQETFMPIKQPKHHWMSQQHNTSRDTFYLARGSHIRQHQI